MKNMPGVDEAMSFNELMKFVLFLNMFLKFFFQFVQYFLKNYLFSQVKTMEYSVVVFDTAPTGIILNIYLFLFLIQKQKSFF